MVASNTAPYLYPEPHDITLEIPEFNSDWFTWSPDFDVIDEEGDNVDVHVETNSRIYVDYDRKEMGFADFSCDNGDCKPWKVSITLTDDNADLPRTTVYEFYITFKEPEYLEDELKEDDYLDDDYLYDDDLAEEYYDEENFDDFDHYLSEIEDFSAFNEDYLRTPGGEVYRLADFSREEIFDIQISIEITVRTEEKMEELVKSHEFVDFMSTLLPSPLPLLTLPSADLQDTTRDDDETSSDLVDGIDDTNDDTDGIEDDIDDIEDDIEDLGA